MFYFLIILLLLVSCDSPTETKIPQVELPTPTDICENNYDAETGELISCDEDCEEHYGFCYNISDLYSLVDFRPCGLDYNEDTPLFDIGYQEWDNGRLITITFFGIQAYEDLLTCLPESIGNFTALTRISFFDGAHQLTSIPESIGNLSSLKNLHLSYNELTSLPESIGNLINLETLDISHNKIDNLPGSIGSLVSLQTLDVSHNQLIILPESIENLTNLETLDASYNQLLSLPNDIGNLDNLWKLFVETNELTSLPLTLCNLAENGTHADEVDGCEDEYENGFGSCLWAIPEETFTYWCTYVDSSEFGINYTINGATVDGQTIPNFNYNLCNELEIDADGNHIDPNNDNHSKIILTNNNLCNEFLESPFDCLDTLEEQNQYNCDCNGITNGTDESCYNITICLDNNALMYTSDTNIAGFQFNHNDCVISTLDGDAGAQGFVVSSSDIAVVGFSLTGATIPSGEGTLLFLNGEITDDCLFNFIFSDTNAQSLESKFYYNGCP